VWHLWKVIEPLYFHTYDADLAERVLGKTIFSAEAGKAGDAITEGSDLTPRLSEISVPTLILVGRDDFICPPSQAKTLKSVSATRSWWYSKRAAMSLKSRNRRPFSKRSEDR
jgi:pimeloyl-ACP methyl ester carboxylesterase